MLVALVAIAVIAGLVLTLVFVSGATIALFVLGLVGMIITAVFAAFRARGVEVMRIQEAVDISKMRAIYASWSLERFIIFVYYARLQNQISIRPQRKSMSL